MLDLPLKDQLTWMHDSTFWGTALVYYSDIKDLITKASQGERDALKTKHWKEYFIGVCNDTTLVEALKDLNFDHKTEVEWLRGEGATDQADKIQVANAMEDGVKKGLESSWLGSGATGSTDFAQWARSKPSDKKKAPDIKTSTIMNCWEYILLTAYKEGIASQDWIHNLYTKVPQSDWHKHMIGGGTPKEYTGPKSKEKPSRGDLIFFDGLAHVALSAGGDKIYSFWPTARVPLSVSPSSSDFDKDGIQDFNVGEFRFKGVKNPITKKTEFSNQTLPSPDKVELTTIQDLKTTRMGHSKRTPVKVTFGPPEW